ncbi:hypothetical protein [Bacillus sp. V5-8f]|uniref:hypothetical protein n=1 Tax=Bacillus sp. V5-8f TaxID=2053044 RepID=UPI000C777297|nr:hypothetical protein [Bacillus sp. V5-8f]PLT33665.1 hypothetical protein CUU64_11080 [Bacillus sp. V5-8f]
MKTRKIKNLKSFFDGSSFPQRAIYYYLLQFFKDNSLIEIKYRDKTFGKEFDVTLTIGVSKKVLVIEYDGAWWHQDLEKDLRKNAYAVNEKVNMLRIREKNCPEMIDPSIDLIQRTRVKSLRELNLRISQAINWVLKKVLQESILDAQEIRKLILMKQEIEPNQMINTIRDRHIIDTIVPQKNKEERLKAVEDMKRDLINLAKANIDNFTTTRQWDKFAEIRKTYKSHYYVHYFNTWKEALEHVGQNPAWELKKQVAIKQGLETIDHVISYSSYKSYLQTIDMDRYISATAIVNIFGTWNEFKKELGISTYEKSKTYSEQELVQIAMENKVLFKNSSKYDQFARKNGLPSQHVYIRNFGSMDAAKEKVGIPIVERNTRVNWPYEELINIAKKYSQHYTTMDKWLSFGKLVNEEEGKIVIPHPTIYQKRFSGWDNSKEIIFST